MKGEGWGLVGESGRDCLQGVRAFVAEAALVPGRRVIAWARARKRASNQADALSCVKYKAFQG